MAKARKIRKRVRTVRSIRTITKTMEMVASARFKRAQAQVSAARPHTDRLTDLVADVVHRGGLEGVDHRLLREPAGVKRDLLLVLTTNRGLCGGYNSSVLRTAAERYGQMTEADYDVVVWVSGSRGIRHLRYRHFEIDRTFTEFEGLPDYHRIGELAEQIMGEFLAGRISGLEVAYMQYISATRHQPAISQILPMEFVEPAQRFVSTPGEATTYEFMPSAEEVLRNLLPATVRLRLWQCFLDAGIGEQVTRMAAMHAASENADDMIHDLTVRYNRMRQAQITSELSEIIGGRMGQE